MENQINDQQPEISWKEAQRFAEDHQQDFIVALLSNSETAVETVLTWGKNTAQSDAAANIGNKLKEQLGWDPEQCKAVSAKVQGMEDMLLSLKESCSKVRSKLIEQYGLFGGGHPMNDVFEILNSAIIGIDALEGVGNG